MNSSKNHEKMKENTKNNLFSLNYILPTHRANKYTVKLQFPFFKKAKTYCSVDHKHLLFNYTNLFYSEYYPNENIMKERALQLIAIKAIRQFDKRIQNQDDSQSEVVEMRQPRLRNQSRGGGDRICRICLTGYKQYFSHIKKRNHLNKLQEKKLANFFIYDLCRKYNRKKSYNFGIEEEQQSGDLYRELKGENIQKSKKIRKEREIKKKAKQIVDQKGRVNNVLRQ